MEEVRAPDGRYLSELSSAELIAYSRSLWADLGAGGSKTVRRDSTLTNEAVTTPSYGTDTVGILVSLRGKFAALATTEIGPGDIHPGILSNIDEAVQALNSGLDGNGKPVSGSRVASGLRRLAPYVSTEDWYNLAGATLHYGSVRMQMLKTYVLDLEQIAEMIES